VLKGTGQNLVIQSQALATSPWGYAGLTATNNSTTAPDSTNTASLLTATAGSSQHYTQSNASSLTYVYNGVYTVSFYAKSGTTRYAQFAVSGTGSIYANVDTTAGTVGTSAGITSSSVVSVGSGWYRFIFTFTETSTNLVQAVIVGISSSTSDARLATWTAAGTETIYVWGVQAEFGSVANTYIPTTTTQVYGTPTLSFSGVAGLGLQSDGSLYVSPAGTGALQAQKTDSTATGGNARGANAVDWQTARNASSQVASGQYSVNGGGFGNTASSLYSGISSGLGNTSSNLVTIVAGGQSNTANGSYSAIVGGISNNSAGYLSFIGGGTANSAAGYFNVIGGGFTNNGTANGAVTTQSGTMNGTTAVTLSGSNASIKVGQYITGTSISSDTYVAAISGTSLTLSKVASGSSTSTLSFYTPHGVVVGGGNNQATGSYSFIGGGGDAGTAGNRNSAAGDWSTISGGFKNSITASSANYGFIGGGQQNSITGLNSVIVGGISNQAGGIGSSVGGGNTNNANSNYSTVVGGLQGTTRSIQGITVVNTGQNPMYPTVGGAQSSILTIGRITTDATATLLTSDGNSASGTNQVILPNNSAYYFRGTVVAGVTGGGNTKGWTVEGLIKRGANAAATTLVGSTVLSSYGDAGATTWTIALSADTTNGGLAVTFTGQAGTTIRTVCQISTTEMTF
jgi:hypothetical protein